jgi:hypothetical protein
LKGGEFEKVKKILLVLSLFWIFYLSLGHETALGANPNPARGARSLNPPDLQNINIKIKAARLVQAEVKELSGTKIIVSKEGKTYTINTNDKTQFRRRFWGKSSFSEISVGHQLTIWGKWADEGQTTINAVSVRDLSVQARNSNFFGRVKTKSAGSFVIETLKRGDQTVVFDDKTKFTNRKQETIKYDDLKVGDRLRVKGLWDSNLNKITQVTKVKDFSLPPLPSASPAKTAKPVSE